MTRRIKRLLDLVGRNGWLLASRSAFLWILRNTVGYRRAVVFCLATGEIQSGDPGSHADWKYLDAESPALEHQAAAIGLTPSAQPMKGDGTFVGLHDGALCFASSVSKYGFTVPNRFSVRFSGKEDAYVGDCVTAEPFRGMGLYPQALINLAVHLRSEGRRRLFLFVESDNLASIRGVRKAGFRPVASCSIFQVGTRTVRRWRTTEPSTTQYLSAWTIQELDTPRSGRSADLGRSAA